MAVFQQVVEPSVRGDLVVGDEVELVENALTISADGFHAQIELFGDGRNAAVACEHEHHFMFAHREGLMGGSFVLTKRLLGHHAGQIVADDQRAFVDFPDARNELVEGGAFV